MKQITKNKQIEQQEKRQADYKKAQKEAMDKALKEFRKSSAYPYVMNFFKEQEERIIKEIETIQNEEMKKVFMLPVKEQTAKIAEMSKRDTILTGILGSLKTIKGKL